MSINNKIVSINNSVLSTGNVSLCYGHFNLIHPGHLRYLQYAKTLSDKLIVAIISDKELDKDLFEHRFSEEERAEGVINLQIVDYVVILNESTFDELIDVIKPKVLVLGKEFKRKQSKQISLAISAANKEGSVKFHAGEIHYFNSNFLHKKVSDTESSNRNKLNSICKDYNIGVNNLQGRLNNFSNAKLAVIGDTIVDNYVACDALGMSAEAPVLVVKELENREFIGGAAIVASHVAALGAKCHYISVVGEDDQSNIVSKSLIEQGISVDLIVDISRPTTYKTRYMVENQKLFRVSRIKDHKISEEIEQEIISKITTLAPDIDGILVSDFVYGVITQNVLNTLSNLSKQFGIKLYGDLQCSSQVGKVSKFNGFDLITPTEKESRIALDDDENGIEWVATTLLKNTNSKNMLMKLGSDGFIAYSSNLSYRQDFPALSVNPVDVTGAGDSLFAAMSVSLSSGSNLIEASIIGTFMASLAVKEVGNTPITNDRLNQYMLEILE
jgi:rfaE bifunctional protein kinase chain/domain